MRTAHRAHIAAIVLVPTLFGQQVPTVRSPQTCSSRAAVSVSSGCGLAREDGELWGLGRAYKVRFLADGVEFTPALGRATPHNLPLSFRLTEVGRRACQGPLAATPVVSATRSTDGLRVCYARATVAEVYEVRPEGVEQSFVFDALPPGSGDLVVRGHIATELIADTTDEVTDSLAFLRAGIGGVHIGTVTGIDAHGQRARGAMRFSDGMLELSLPAAFVDSAALPLVLDPLLGAAIGVATTGNDDETPDVAYHYSGSGGGIYLVAWARRFSLTDVDIRGQRLDARTGAFVGGLIGIRGGTLLSDAPAVAVVSLRGRFVVAWREQSGSNPAYIAACSVAAADGAVTSALQVVAGTDTFGKPDVGGDRDDLDDEAIIVYSNLTQGQIEATRVAMASTGVLTRGSRSIVSPAESLVTQAAISQVCGRDGRHLIAWMRTGTMADTWIECAVVDRFLGVRDRPELTTALGALESLPAVAGDGLHWMVAYDSTSAGADPDIHCTWVTYEPRTDTAYVRRPIVAAGGSDLQSRAAVAFLFDSALLAYTDDVLGARRGAFVRSLDWFSCAPCEGLFTVDGDNQRHVGNVAVTHGAQEDEGLIVWETQDPSTSNGDIRAQRFEPDDGQGSRILGSACGPDVDVYATCGRRGRAQFALRLEHAEPSRPVAILIAANAFPTFRCGSCVIHDPFRNLVFPIGTTDVQGNATVTLPIPQSGVNFGFQFFYQPLASAGCPALGVSFSRVGLFGTQ